MTATRASLIFFISILTFIPSLAKATALSDLTAATAANTINNGNNLQQWQWNSLNQGPALEFYTNSTVATGEQIFLDVQINGANSNNNITSIAGEFTNAHTGTGSFNEGVYASAFGGAHNFSVNGQLSVGNAGDAGVWGDAQSVGGAYGVLGNSASSTGYAGYFNNTGGGYAAAFMGGKVGIGTATPLAQLHQAGGLTAGAWGLNGVAYRQDAATYTDNSSAAGTVTNNMVNAIAQPTLAT